jgi:hypothetical protein
MLLRSALKRLHFKPIRAPLISAAATCEVFNEERHRYLAATILAIFGLSATAVTLCDDKPESADKVQWPIYRRKDVEIHKSNENGIWVTYEDGKQRLNMK